MISSNNSNFASRTKYLIDSGASIHVFRKYPFSTSHHYNTKQKLQVRGFGGQVHIATSVGIHPAIGRYAVIPTSNIDILSVSELLLRGFTCNFDSPTTCSLISAAASVATHSKALVWRTHKSSDNLFYISSTQLLHLTQATITCASCNSATLGLKGPRKQDDVYSKEQRIRATEVPNYTTNYIIYLTQSSAKPWIMV